MSQVNPVNKAQCLELLCESNFEKLFRLIPNLLRLRRSAIGRTDKKPELHLDILESSSHTLTIELSHCFNQQLQEFMEPAVKIRIYLDAGLAEVIRDHARHDVSRVYQCPSKTIEIRDYKWKLNYFLQKWLDHCLQTKYDFSETGKDMAMA